MQNSTSQLPDEYSYVKKDKIELDILLATLGEKNCFI